MFQWLKNKPWYLQTLKFLYTLSTRQMKIWIRRSSGRSRSRQSRSGWSRLFVAAFPATCTERSEIGLNEFGLEIDQHGAGVDVGWTEFGGIVGRRFEFFKEKVGLHDLHLVRLQTLRTVNGDAFYFGADHVATKTVDIDLVVYVEMYFFVKRKVK